MNNNIVSRLNLAKDIALYAGTLALEMRKNQSASFSKEKAHQDFVTIADLAVEDMIRAKISLNFPSDSILGEEEGTTGCGDALWVIDPIDGTTNYMRGLTDWCISIGFCLNGKIECGAIYAPDIDTLVWAQAGQGAFVGDVETKVSDRNTLKDALILLGRSGRCEAHDYQQLLGRVFENGLEYRRNGSAAFSLLTVALGRADAFYEGHLNPWDAMAGILILQEAGGTVDFPNHAEFLEHGGPVLASNSLLHNKIWSVVQDYMPN